MKSLHLTTYKIYRKPLQQPLRAIVFSDLHFSYLVTTDRLTALLDLFRAIRPDYFLCPGDVVDYLNLVDDSDDYLDAAPDTCRAERRRLLGWLTEVGKIAPLIISLGNHDVYRLNPPERQQETGRRWLIERYSELFQEINALPGVTVLDNATFSDDEIMVLGLTLTSKYYQDGARTGKKSMARAQKNSRTTLIDPLARTDLPQQTPRHPLTEDKSELLSTLDHLNPRLLYNLPKHPLKFALIHSPVHLTDPAVQRRLAEYDFFISGHMHNGVVPPGLDEIWRSRRGLLSPTRNLYPDHIRRTFRTYRDKLIVTGAITTIHQCSGPLHYLNAAFPSYLSLLEFTNDPVCQHKPYIRRQYLGYGESPKL